MWTGRTDWGSRTLGLPWLFGVEQETLAHWGGFETPYVCKQRGAPCVFRSKCMLQSTTEHTLARHLNTTSAQTTYPNKEIRYSRGCGKPMLGRYPNITALCGWTGLPETDVRCYAVFHLAQRYTHHCHNITITIHFSVKYQCSTGLCTIRLPLFAVLVNYPNMQCTNAVIYENKERSTGHNVRRVILCTLGVRKTTGSCSKTLLVYTGIFF